MFRSFSFISHSDGFHVTHKTVKSDRSADFSCGLQREAGLRSTLRHSVIFTQIPVLKSKTPKRWLTSFTQKKTLKHGICGTGEAPPTRWRSADQTLIAEIFISHSVSVLLKCNQNFICNDLRSCHETHCTQKH